MKTIYLLRHAKSGWDNVDLTDHDRTLAPRGIAAATLVGRHLASRFGAPDTPMPALVLCSTARRASDTLDLVLAEWTEQPPPHPVVEREHGLYLCGDKVLLQRIRDVPDTVPALMVVAHNPDLHRLALTLCGTGNRTPLTDILHEKFPTGACAILSLPVNRWSATGREAGRLVDFVRPRKLA